MGLYPNEQAEGVTTWADGHGIWHATADNEAEAKQAIMRELRARTAIGRNYRLKVENVQGRHWKEK